MIKRVLRKFLGWTSDYQAIQTTHNKHITENAQHLVNEILHALALCQKFIDSQQPQQATKIENKLNKIHEHVLNVLSLHQKQVEQLSNEYQKDIETIIHCYQAEKQQFKKDFQKQQQDLNSVAKQFQQIDSAYQAEQQQRLNVTEILHRAEDQIIQLKTTLATEQKLRLHAETIHQELIAQMSLSHVTKRYQDEESSS